MHSSVGSYLAWHGGGEDNLQVYFLALLPCFKADLSTTVTYARLATLRSSQDSPAFTSNFLSFPLITEVYATTSAFIWNSAIQTHVAKFTRQVLIC